MYLNYNTSLTPEEARQNLKKCLDFLQNYKTIIFVGGGLIGLQSVGALQGLWIICANSSLVNICGNIIHVQEMKKLIKELQSLEQCRPALQNLHQVLANSEILDSEKINHIEYVLFSMNELPDIGDLKTTMINCFVKLLTTLYFLKIGEFNLVIEALIDAFKKKKLSSRLFHIILRMLQRRGIPIDEILKAVM